MKEKTITVKLTEKEINSILRSLVFDYESLKDIIADLGDEEHYKEELAEKDIIWRKLKKARDGK